MATEMAGPGVAEEKILIGVETGVTAEKDAPFQVRKLSAIIDIEY